MTSESRLLKMDRTTYGAAQTQAASCAAEPVWTGLVFVLRAGNWSVDIQTQFSSSSCA